MADVQQVEAAVGEGDRAARRARVLDACRQLVARQHLTHARDPFTGDAVTDRTRTALRSLGGADASPCRASSPRGRRRSSPAAPRVSNVAPAASASVIVAITVSPAPVTSAISSEPKIGMCTVGAPGTNSAMPRLPRVISTACILVRSSISRPARSSTRDRR